MEGTPLLTFISACIFSKFLSYYFLSIQLQPPMKTLVIVPLQELWTWNSLSPDV